MNPTRCALIQHIYWHTKLFIYRQACTSSKPFLVTLNCRKRPRGYHDPRKLTVTINAYCGICSCRCPLTTNSSHSAIWYTNCCRNAIFARRWVVCRVCVFVWVRRGENETRVFHHRFNLHCMLSYAIWSADNGSRLNNHPQEVRDRTSLVPASSPDVLHRECISIDAYTQQFKKRSYRYIYECWYMLN